MPRKEPASKTNTQCLLKAGDAVPFLRQETTLDKNQYAREAAERQGRGEDQRERLSDRWDDRGKGYVRGGVTAMGAKKDFPVYLDETAELWEVISVSAGVRGTQILLHPEAYGRATGARVGEIGRFPV